MFLETPVVRQSERPTLYQDSLSRLRGKGLIYPCRRPRREILDGIARAPQVGDLADERARDDEGDLVAWRLSIDAAEQALVGFDSLVFEDTSGRRMADPKSVGDVVLGWKDLGASYNLAMVVDDAPQGLNVVIRGEDLFAATHVQRLLQALLSLPTPAYRHHPLLLRADGKRRPCGT